MKLLLSLLTCLLLGSLSTFAQEGKFLPGYVLPSGGDTLRGYLKVRHADFMAKRIQYASREEATEVTRYQPDEIAGYGFDKGEVYVSRTTDRGGPFFLHWFFDGELDFYYLRDSVDHYYVADEGELIHLMDTEQDIKTNEGLKRFRNREYVGQLMRVIEDFSLQPVVDATELNQKSLIKLGKAYQEKVRPGVSAKINQQKRILPRVRPELVAEWNQSALFFGGTFSPSGILYVGGLMKEEIGASMAYGFAVKLDNLPIFSDRVGFRTGITFLRMGEMRNWWFTGRPLLYRVPLEIEYKLRRGQWYPTVTLGGTYYWVTAPPDLNQKGTGFEYLQGGLGLHYEPEKWGRFSLYGRYEYGLDQLVISLAAGW